MSIAVVCTGSSMEAKLWLISLSQSRVGLFGKWGAHLREWGQKIGNEVKLEGNLLVRKKHQRALGCHSQQEAHFVKPSTVLCRAAHLLTRGMATEELGPPTALTESTLNWEDLSLGEGTKTNLSQLLALISVSVCGHRFVGGNLLERV